MAFSLAGSPMQCSLSLVARGGIALACLAYAVWGVDFSRLLTVLAGFSPGFVAVYLLAALAVTGIPGLRLRFLTGDRIPAGTGVRACLLGLALNNILPARLGEVAKALYLRREATLSFARALEVVFWERFFDLNALLLLGGIVAGLLGQRVIFYPLLAVVGGGWCFFAFLSASPVEAHGLLRFVPGQRLRLFAAELFGLFEANLRASFLGQLSLWTVAAWIGYGVAYAVGLWGMAGLEVDPLLLLTVFAVTTLGFAVPAAPGGLGVYEASMVLALGWFGVEKERALAIGLAMHMLQYLPITVAGLWALAASGLSMDDLRKQAAVAASPPGRGA